MKIKNIFGFHAWIFGSVWLLLFMAGKSKLFRDPGSFFHTVIGEHILDTAHLIYWDSFSFTRFGEPWIAQQWLGECIMAVIQRLAGLDGLLVVTVSLIALLYSHLALRIERSGMNLALGSLILGFVPGRKQPPLSRPPPYRHHLLYDYYLFAFMRYRIRTEKHLHALLVDTCFCHLVEHPWWCPGWALHSADCGRRLDNGLLART